MENFWRTSQAKLFLNSVLFEKQESKLDCQMEITWKQENYFQDNSPTIRYNWANFLLCNIESGHKTYFYLVWNATIYGD